MPAIPGAIRWDAWYGENAASTEAFVKAYVESTLTRDYLYRAPWFAQPVSRFLNGITAYGNTQAVMDAEITYAHDAGLSYWAYLWYGQQTPESPFQHAWTLHQSSSIKNDMNWCLMWQLSRLGNASTFAGRIATYVGYMGQANYQTVLGGRPLLYLFVDNDTSVNSSWGGSYANLGTSLTALRTACSNAGLGDPYVVIQYGYAPTAATIATATGSQAISHYSVGTVDAFGGSYAAFDTSVRADWAARAATGTAVVPVCMVGWDTRPRKEFTFAPNARLPKPYQTRAAFIVPPTGPELTTHLQAAAAYVAANPAVCPSGAALIYSWNECDEGGSLLPQYGTGAAPVTTYLDAFAAVMW